MRCLVDYHHGDLHWSLHSLFENRLGFDLYHPVGHDWFKEGFWRIAEVYGNAPDTIDQFLAISEDTEHFDQFKRLNGIATEYRDHWKVWDPTHGYDRNCVTFNQFRNWHWDLIIATLPCQEEPFRQLAKEKGCAFAVQMGNYKQTTSAKHVLYSAPYAPTAGQNALYYHQEVDRGLLFYEPPRRQLDGRPRITSMVNLHPNAEVWEAYLNEMPDCAFYAFGANCPDGPLKGCVEIAPWLRNSNLGWNLKPFDGFSHTAMAWYASGRPCVVRMSDIMASGMDAPNLFEDGVTCLAIDGLSVQDGAKKIRHALEPEENLRMCEAARDRFKVVCNYDLEELQIRGWLEKVLNDS